MSTCVPRLRSQQTYIPHAHTWHRELRRPYQACLRSSTKKERERGHWHTLKQKQDADRVNNHSAVTEGFNCDNLQMAAHFRCAVSAFCVRNVGQAPSPPALQCQMPAARHMPPLCVAHLSKPDAKGDNFVKVRVLTKPVSLTVESLLEKPQKH
eukprot:3622124-Amphidinium_carterae.1